MPSPPRAHAAHTLKTKRVSSSIDRVRFGRPWAAKRQPKCKGVVLAHRAEVMASCSGLLSLHCPRHLLLLALLPACAVSQVIMRQDCSAYAKEPLRTVGLREAAHQYSVQDVHGSANTPTLAPLPIQK